jgi:hypothetical protein
VATDLPPQEHPPESPYDTVFLLTLGTVFAAVIGVSMLVFSLTYVQDMAALAAVPDQIWNWLCGQPIESSITLPLLLTLSIVSFLTSGVLFGVRWWLQRRA